MVWLSALMDAMDLSIFPSMKSISACILVVHVLLTSLTPAGLVELLRAPALADHYQEHLIETGGAMSLSDFLLLHFIDPDHEDQDGRRHGRLPFHDRTAAGGVFVLESAPILVPFEGRVVKVHERVAIGSFGDWPGRSVFHPPKAVC